MEESILVKIMSKFSTFHIAPDNVRFFQCSDRSDSYRLSGLFMTAEMVR
jgi:hypothetical protein